MPELAAIGLVVMLVFTVLSALPIPWFLKVITIPCALGGLSLAAMAFREGDDLQWMELKYLSRFEDGCVTSEIDEEEK